MILTFSIDTLKIDITEILIDDYSREWWFKNCKIPLNTKVENLTEENKIQLIKLAMYENYLSIEELCNLSNNNFKLKNNKNENK